MGRWRWRRGPGRSREWCPCRFLRGRLREALLWMGWWWSTGVGVGGVGRRMGGTMQYAWPCLFGSWGLDTLSGQSRASMY